MRASKVVLLHFLIFYSAYITSNSVNQHGKYCKSFIQTDTCRNLLTFKQAKHNTSLLKCQQVYLNKKGVSQIRIDYVRRPLSNDERGSIKNY